MTLGGPIKSDKVFFFVNYDGQRRTQDTSQVVTVPTAALRNGPFRFVTSPARAGRRSRIVPAAWTRAATRWCPSPPTTTSHNDPRRLGLDPVMQNERLAFLPLPNDFTGGDGLNFAGYRWNSPSRVARGYA